MKRKREGEGGRKGEREGEGEDLKVGTQDNAQA